MSLARLTEITTFAADLYSRLRMRGSISITWGIGGRRIPLQKSARSAPFDVRARPKRVGNRDSSRRCNFQVPLGVSRPPPRSSNRAANGHRATQPTRF